MKICTKCFELKDETEFNWKSKSKGIRQAACKVCSRIEGKSHYQRNKSRVVERVVERTVLYRKTFQDWKSTLACTTCGESDPACLDFHHLGLKKKDNILAVLVNRGQLTRAKEEVKKCVVICSNCHRKHHAGRLPLTNDHLLASQRMFETLDALVSPLASNQDER